MGDKITRVLGFNPVIENILVMEVAIILISISLLILALSYHRFKESLMPVKSSSSSTLPK
jgi:hypothetical protein